VLLLCFFERANQVRSNLFCDLYDLVENLILVTLDHPSIIDKRADPETVVFALSALEKNLTVFSKQSQQPRRRGRTVIRVLAEFITDTRSLVCCVLNGYMEREQLPRGATVGTEVGQIGQ